MIATQCNGLLYLQSIFLPFNLSFQDNWTWYIVVVCVSDNDVMILREN